MSKTVHIASTAQFSTLLGSSSIVVADFYADWCGPCKAIAPMYEQLSAQLSRPNRITFVKINTDQQQELAQAYGVRAMPTFMIFKNARKVETIQGADQKRLSEAVKKLAAEANSIGEGPANGGFGEGSSAGGMWLGAGLPKGYGDITDQVDVLGLELLNRDADFGTARTLFGSGKPKGTADDKSDYVESDTDEQLMLYIPFQSTLKIHSLQITSYAPSSDDDSDAPSRPSKIKIYTNRSHILGFDEADDIPATQEIYLTPNDWDSKTNTAKMELRFVKFQNISSLVLFVVECENSDAEKTRLDRVRIIGETGEKRDPGKLEKIGEDEG